MYLNHRSCVWSQLSLPRLSGIVIIICNDQFAYCASPSDMEMSHPGKYFCRNFEQIFDSLFRPMLTCFIEIWNYFLYSCICAYFSSKNIRDNIFVWKFYSRSTVYTSSFFPTFCLPTYVRFYFDEHPQFYFFVAQNDWKNLKRTHDGYDKLNLSLKVFYHKNVSHGS